MKENNKFTVTKDFLFDYNITATEAFRQYLRFKYNEHSPKYGYFAIKETEDYIEFIYGENGEAVEQEYIDVLRETGFQL